MWLNIKIIEEINKNKIDKYLYTSINIYYYLFCLKDNLNLIIIMFNYLKNWGYFKVS